MQKGDKAILIPGNHNVKGTGSSAHKSRVAEILRSMTEEVTIVQVNEFTGNAKVRDKRNMVFYCNILDLRPFRVNV
jgi:hypothetical protein